eukprot:7376482-Prymnesium_polylepis.1
MCGSWLLVRADYVPDGSEPCEYSCIHSGKVCVKSREYRVVSGRMGAQCVLYRFLYSVEALYIYLALRHAT